jgi:hypothetical protein
VGDEATVGGEVVAGDNIQPQENFAQPLTVVENEKGKGRKHDKLSVVLVAETVAACLIAGGIFLTNVLMPDSAINTFINSLTATEQSEAAYSDFTLSPIVSTLSDAQITVTDDGVLCFTDQTSIYPVCGGTITSITQNDNLYTVEIAHTSQFTSVFTGLDSVYYEVGDTLYSNLPFAYSNGNNEVQCSMYDGDTLLNCYYLSGALPVWKA